jgi:hypothetical protein
MITQPPGAFPPVFLPDRSSDISDIRVLDFYQEIEGDRR